MSVFTIATEAGKTIARKMMVAYLNVNTETSPKWAPIGKRVEDSSVEFDWGLESTTDIFDTTWTTAKTPSMTQTFDPCELDAGDEAQALIWETAVVEQDVAALTNMDVLIVHLYAQRSSSQTYFGERYNSCAVLPSSLGGAGGSPLAMPIDITFGGKRSIGDVTVDDGTVTFEAIDED